MKENMDVRKHLGNNDHEDDSCSRMCLWKASIWALLQGKLRGNVNVLWDHLSRELENLYAREIRENSAIKQLINLL